MSPTDRERLLASQRRLLTGMVLLIAFLVVLVVVEVGLLGLRDRLAVGLAALVVWPLVEWQLLRPQRRVLAEIGLSKAEAGAIITRERERRSPLAALTPEERVERFRRRRSVWLAVGAVAAVMLVVGGFYAVQLGGQTHDEGDSLAPLGTAVLAVAVGFVLAPVAFAAASGLGHRIRAESPD